MLTHSTVDVGEEARAGEVLRKLAVEVEADVRLADIQLVVKTRARSVDVIVNLQPSIKYLLRVTHGLMCLTVLPSKEV